MTSRAMIPEIVEAQANDDVENINSLTKDAKIGN